MDIKVKILEATDIVGADKSGTSDPYVIASILNMDGPKKKTKVIKKTLRPVWDEEFTFDGRDALETVEFAIWDYNMLRDVAIGEAKCDLSTLSLSPATWQDTWLKLTGVESGTLHVAFQVTPKLNAKQHPAIYLQPPPTYSVTEFNPTLFIPPPPGYFGSTPYSPSQIITYESGYKFKNLSIQRWVAFHGPPNLIAQEFVDAINHLTSSLAINSEKKVETPLLVNKIDKKQPTLHWKANVTVDFQELYLEDLLAAILNLFEMWGWRYEKHYTAVGGAQNNRPGVYSRVLVFRRAMYR